MTRKITISKLAITAVLTVLIWVWADLALEEQYFLANARLTVAKSVEPSLWVTLDSNSTLPIRRVVLKGTARRISDVRRRVSEGSLATEFFFDPAQQRMSQSGVYPLDLADFIEKADRMKQLGLSVVSCDPNVATVSIVELQQKQLQVKCYDQYQNIVKTDLIDPPQITAFVPAEWSGEALTAKVVLTQREIEQARVAPIQKTPVVELGAGQVRQAAEAVKISTSGQAQRLLEYTVTNVRLGFSLSANLQGKYRVELLNPEIVMGPVAIRATAEAKRAYDDMRYQVILQIDDSDRDLQTGEGRRELVYNFPEEYVRKDEILLNQPAAEARFKLSAALPATPAVEGAVSP